MTVSDPGAGQQQGRVSGFCARTSGAQWCDLHARPRFRCPAPSPTPPARDSGRDEDVRPWVSEDGDSRCQDCGRRNPLWTADNGLWNRVLTGDPEVPRDGVILCPTCFATRADPLTLLGVKVVACPHPDEISSGRDEAREAVARRMCEQRGYDWEYATDLSRRMLRILADELLDLPAVKALLREETR